MATVLESDQKAPFSIIGEGGAPFPGLLHFTLDMYLILPSFEQGGCCGADKHVDPANNLS